MIRSISCSIWFTGLTILSGWTTSLAQEAVVIDVNRQKLEVLHDGAPVVSFPVSTSRFGLGDSFQSYKTPLGKLEICGKLGEALPLGAVIKGGRPTGEILAPNAPGRDPMVTRVLCLQGLEDQNRHALGRGIYIHGTPEEGNIGKPVSWGCIRMRSRDVVSLFNKVRVGTKVIINGRGSSDKRAKAAPEVERSSAFSAWRS